MNSTRKRDMPAGAMTKREKAAILFLAHNPSFGPVEAVQFADALFDELDFVPELAHAYDEPDFDHEGTP